MLQTIYVVEDDENIRDLVVYAFASAGFEAQGFSDGAALYEALGACSVTAPAACPAAAPSVPPPAACPAAAPAVMPSGVPDLLLLDIMLPGDDGITILKKLRASQKTARLPIIMLTAKSFEYDRIKGLDLGADDYVTKPFSVIEVISRARAVLRRSAPDAEARCGQERRVGAITLSPEKRRVHAAGAEIPLTYKEFELLDYLMRNEGFVLSRDKILSEVWGYDYPGESRTVDMHVKTLRKKLGDCGSAIKTVRNVGYKIEGI
jgi:two-component system alkaline phosphatase synthesis response regulator PhoP